MLVADLTKEVLYTRFAANIDFLFTTSFLERFLLQKKVDLVCGISFPYSYQKDEIANQLMRSGVQVILFDFPAGKWEMGERGLHPIPVGWTNLKKRSEAVAWAEYLGVKS